jgi:hypothetical protein
MRWRSALSNLRLPGIRLHRRRINIGLSREAMGDGPETKISRSS